MIVTFSYDTPLNLPGVAALLGQIIATGKDVWTYTGHIAGCVRTGKIDFFIVAMSDSSFRKVPVDICRRIG